MTAVVTRARRAPDRLLYGALLSALAAPLVVAIVVLHDDRWYPVLDLAMTEVRVRQVGGGDTPLIGLPGRIGELPAQGSHPGPLSFWLLAPAYHLFGSGAWALELGTVLIHLAVIGVALWLGHRLGGRAGMVLVAVVVAVAMRGYGTLLLTQPWNPYLPLLAWLLVLLAAWAVVAGDHRWLVVVAAAGTLCAQTHIPYLLLGGGMFLICAGLVAVRTIRTGDGTARRDGWRALAIAGTVGAMLWLPPLIQELQGGDGNISRLLRYFRSPPEPAIGLGESFELLLRHLNVVDGFVGLVHGSQRFMAVGLDGASAVLPGAIVGVVWIAAAVASFAGIGSKRLRALHVVLGVALVLSVASMARIFGTTWYYLTLWAWGTTALVLVAVVWTALAAVARLRPSIAATGRAGLVGAALIIVAVSTAMFTADATDAEHPEASLGDQVGAMIEPTRRAVLDGAGAATGAQGAYLVQGSDAHFFGSQVFALINELDRAGLDVGGEPYFTVANTPELTMDPARATAEIHYATGSYIARWRQVPEAVEVAYSDLRTQEEKVRYAALREQALDGLRRDGLDDLVPLIDTNVFGLATRAEIADDTRKVTSEMLDLGTAAAVFVIPKGTRLAG